jgi:gluconolactonase
MKRGLVVLFACAAIVGPAFAQLSPVTRLDPALDAIVAADAPVELAADGFGFTEGPVWMHGPNGGYLLFTDVPGNTIWKLENGKASVFLLNAGYQGPDMYRYGGLSSNGLPKNDPRHEEFSMTGPDGLTRDRQNRLVIATFAGRKLVRIEKNGKRTVLADNYNGKKFSGPNDAVVKSDGAIYFTDTFGGLRLRDKDPKVEIDHNALFLWKNGKVTELIKGEMPYYNGLAFSPDEKYLYLNGGDTNDVHRYEVKSDDTLANGKQLFDMAPDKTPGVADGMRVDSAGNIYETGPGGIWIVTPDGKHLGTIAFPQKPINIGFGDRDMRTLYVAAHTAIYKIRVKIPGL